MFSKPVQLLDIATLIIIKIPRMSLQHCSPPLATCHSSSCQLQPEHTSAQMGYLSPDLWNQSFPEFVFSELICQTEGSLVWKGCQRGNSHQLALKLTETLQQEGSARLHRQRQQAFLKQHKLERMVKVVQFQEKGNFRLLAMEYCPWSLGQLIVYFSQSPARSYTQCHLNFIVYAFRGILQSVQQLHGAGYVHRDLKPDNFLLDSNLNVLLNDFEIITKVGTVDSSFSGTLDYMAPERMQRNRGQPIGTGVDVWSLGIILYELFTGCTPFNGCDPQEMLEDIYEGHLIGKRIPLQAMELIRQMLQIRSDKRLKIEQIKSSAFLQRQVDVGLIRGTIAC